MEREMGQGGRGWYGFLINTNCGEIMWNQCGDDEGSQIFTEIG
jgi:hypothetical protein